MNDILKNIYYNPKTGFKTYRRLYEEAKKIDKSITLKDVKAFLQQQEEFQINKRNDYVKQYQYKITAPIGYYQMDLTFYPKFGAKNRNYTVMLNAIEIPTRKGYIIPLKSKTEDNIAGAIKKLLTLVDNKMKAVTTDNGSEFLNKSVQQIFKDNRIKHYTCQVGDHHIMGMIERFNRTIKNYLRRYFTSHKTYNWIDIIDDILYNYNHSYHSSIESEPVNMNIQKINRARSDAIQFNSYVRDALKIKVNDLVRVKLNQDKFDKEGEHWTKSTYVVVSLIGNKFQVKNKESDYVSNKLYSTNQLLKVEPIAEEFKPEVVDERPKIVKEHKQKVVLKKEGIEQSNVVEGKRKFKPTEKNTLKLR